MALAIVGLLCLGAVCVTNCAHRRLPADFPNGPDIGAWVQRHWQTKKLAREQGQIETEIPKLTDDH